MQSPYIPCTKPHVLFTSLGSYQKLSLSRTQMHFFRIHTYIPCTKPHVLFTSLGSYQKLSLSRTQMHFFRNKAIVYSEELLIPLPYPKWKTSPCQLSAHNYPSYWRSFPHPQPEDAPCRGDRDALHGILPNS